MVMMMIGSTISAIVSPPASRLWPLTVPGPVSGLEQLHEDGEPQDPVDDGGHTGEVADVRVDESGEPRVAGVLPHVDRGPDAERHREEHDEEHQIERADEPLLDARVRRKRRVTVAAGSGCRGPSGVGTAVRATSKSSTMRTASAMTSVRNSRTLKAVSRGSRRRPVRERSTSARVAAVIRSVATQNPPRTRRTNRSDNRLRPSVIKNSSNPTKNRLGYAARRLGPNRIRSPAP